MAVLLRSSRPSQPSEKTTNSPQFSLPPNSSGFHPFAVILEMDPSGKGDGLLYLLVVRLGLKLVRLRLRLMAFLLLLGMLWKVP